MKQVSLHFDFTPFINDQQYYNHIIITIIYLWILRYDSYIRYLCFSTFVCVHYYLINLLIY